MLWRATLLPVVVSGVMACCLTVLAGPTSTPKLRAVYWTGGIAHDFDAMTKVLVPVLERRIPADLQIVRDGSFLDSTDAAQIDLIIMNHCFESVDGVLTTGQQDKLLDLIRGGVGVVAIHGSYYSFVKWDEVHELFGARFTKHGSAKAVLEVHCVDQKHPVMKNVNDTFEIVSELYQSTPLADDCHVLARAKERGTTQEYPSVWTRRYGKGRIVTLLPGHWPDSFRVPEFQELIASSALWVAKQTRSVKQPTREDRP